MSDSLWEDCCYATGGATIIMTAFRLVKTVYNHVEENKKERLQEEYAEINRMSAELHQKREIRLLKEQIAKLQRESDTTTPVCGY